MIKAVERGRLVTIISCITADGESVPPMFVFPGAKTHDQDVKVKLGPPHGVRTNSKRGWINHEVFQEWLVHFKQSV